MKKTNLIFIFLIATFLFATVAIAEDTKTTYITDLARLKFSLISQDPDPAEPGGMVEIRWKVENLGSENAKDVVIKLEPEYPFSLLPGDDGIRDIGSIQGRQIDEEGVIILYKLRVDERAIEGDNELELKFKFGTNNAWAKIDPAIVRVQTIDAALAVESVESEPALIIPGNSAKVKMDITNLADSYMKDITVKLDLTFSQFLQYVTTVSDTAVYYDALPFAPVDSTTEKRIAQIGPGQTKTVEFDLIAYSDAESRAYKVPIIITFYDELEEQHTMNDIIGLVVGSVPELDIVLESSDVNSRGAAGTVSVKFVNKGITDIKFLNVNLKESADYDITSAYTDYLGNVDSDDYETAEFDIYLKKTASEMIKLPLHITYKDANNNDYAEDVELELKLFSETQRGQPKSRPVGWIVFIIIILVIAWLVYRRWEKKRKKKRQE